MVSKAPFGPGDPGSNPGWFAVSKFKSKIEFSQIIQACSTLENTITLQGAFL